MGGHVFGTAEQITQEGSARRVGTSLLTIHAKAVFLCGVFFSTSANFVIRKNFGLAQQSGTFSGRDLARLLHLFPPNGASNALSVAGTLYVFVSEND